MVDVRLSLRAAFYAGIAAGIVSTVGQVVLWLVFTDAFPEVLLRDTRYAAAIVLGEGAIIEGFGLPVIGIAATLVHFALSIAYGAAVGFAIHNMGGAASLVVGAVFGAAIYTVNMYGFTAVFPWFANARDLITLAAHVVFGVVAALVYRCVAPSSRAP